MREFMRDGGLPMWVMLITALGAGAAAVWGGRDGRARILGAGVAAVLAESLLGMATGIIATSRAAESNGDVARILAYGLRELANNGILGGALALLLLGAWLYVTRSGEEAH